MRPLWFLMTRSVFNGFKRSVTSARRLLGVLFLIATYAVQFYRPGMNRRDWNGIGTGKLPELNLPPLQVVSAYLFAGFAVISFFQMMMLFGYRGSFKSADVDVLFPTPISPKAVLGFRMIRDSLGTILGMLIFVFLFLRPTGATSLNLFKNLPTSDLAVYAPRLMQVSWLLSVIGWTTIATAASLRYYRPDANSDSFRKRAAWALVLAIVGILSLLALQIYQAVGEPAKLIGITENPLWRTVFFNATGMLGIVEGAVLNKPLLILVGLGINIAPVVLGIWLAMKQTPWLYEQGAYQVEFVHKVSEARKNASYVDMVSEQARKGKFKSGRQGWLFRQNWTGWRALVWKEMLIQGRAAKGMILLTFIIVAGMNVFPTILLAHTKHPERIGLLGLLMQSMAVFATSSMFAQSGFLELLRRGDLQKPLPFSASHAIFFETISKSIYGVIVALVSPLVLVLIAPRMASFGAAGAILMPSLAIVLTATIGMITMMFPDVEDPTQRAFRGLMTLLAFGIFLGPPTALFVGLVYLKVSPIIASFPVAVVNVGLAVLASSIAGRLYASFNPSE